MEHFIVILFDMVKLEILLPSNITEKRCQNKLNAVFKRVLELWILINRQILEIADIRPDFLYQK